MNTYHPWERVNAFLKSLGAPEPISIKNGQIIYKAKDSNGIETHVELDLELTCCAPGVAATDLWRAGLTKPMKFEGVPNSPLEELETILQDLLDV